MSVDGRLKQRLAEQLKSESDSIQGVTQQRLDAMRIGLKVIYENALRTIETDMESQNKALAKRFRRLMLWPSLALVMISVGISAGAWAFTQYQWGQIQEQRLTLDRLQTLGVEAVKTESGKSYLILPRGVGLSEVRITRDTKRPFVEMRR